MFPKRITRYVVLTTAVLLLLTTSLYALDFNIVKVETSDFSVSYEEIDNNRVIVDITNHSELWFVGYTSVVETRNAAVVPEKVVIGPGQSFGTLIEFFPNHTQKVEFGLTRDSGLTNVLIGLEMVLRVTPAGLVTDLADAVSGEDFRLILASVLSDRGVIQGGVVDALGRAASDGNEIEFAKELSTVISALDLTKDEVAELIRRTGRKPLANQYVRVIEGVSAVTDTVQASIFARSIVNTSHNATVSLTAFPKGFSHEFLSDDAVFVDLDQQKLHLRQEPGDFSDYIALLLPNTQGVVVSNPRNGIPVSGYFWQYVNFPGYGTGWVAEDFLALDPTVTDFSPAPREPIEADFDDFFQQIYDDLLKPLDFFGMGGGDGWEIISETTTDVGTQVTPTPPPPTPITEKTYHDIRTDIGNRSVGPFSGWIGGQDERQDAFRRIKEESAIGEEDGRFPTFIAHVREPTHSVISSFSVLVRGYLERHPRTLPPALPSGPRVRTVVSGGSIIVDPAPSGRSWGLKTNGRCVEGKIANGVYKAPHNPTSLPFDCDIDLFDGASRLNSIAVSIQPELPAAPAEVTAVPEVDKMSLEWSYVEGADMYLVEQGIDGVFTQIDEIEDTVCIAAGLQSNTAYQYRVYSQNVTGRSVGFAEVDATTKAPPEPVVVVSETVIVEQTLYYTQHNKLWKMDTDGGDKKQMTFSEGVHRLVSPSPDGTSLIFVRIVSGAQDFFLRKADGSETQLTSDGQIKGRAIWLSDGTRAVFSSRRDGTYGLYSIDIATNVVTTILDHPNSDERDPVPLGDEQIVFWKQVGSEKDMYVCRTDGSGVARWTSNGSVTHPFPTSDGTQIVFVKNGNLICVMDAKAGAEDRPLVKSADVFTVGFGGRIFFGTGARDSGDHIYGGADLTGEQDVQNLTSGTGGLYPFLWSRVVSSVPAAPRRGLRDERRLDAPVELPPNYPNPANPETWMPYDLAREAHVALSIYDVGGTLVRTIAVGYRDAGAYRGSSRAIHWDGRNQWGEPVSSGVYFYRLTAGEYTAVRKLVVLK